MAKVKTLYEHRMAEMHKFLLKYQFKRRFPYIYYQRNNQITIYNSLLELISRYERRNNLIGAWYWRWKLVLASNFDRIIYIYDLGRRKVKQEYVVKFTEEIESIGRGNSWDNGCVIVKTSSFLQLLNMNKSEIIYDIKLVGRSEWVIVPDVVLGGGSHKEYRKVDIYKIWGAGIFKYKSNIYMEIIKDLICTRRGMTVLLKNKIIHYSYIGKELKEISSSHEMYPACEYYISVIGELCRNKILGGGKQFVSIWLKSHLEQGYLQIVRVTNNPRDYVLRVTGIAAHFALLYTAKYDLLLLDLKYTDIKLMAKRTLPNPLFRVILLP